MQIVIDIPKEIVEWASKYCDYIKIFNDKNTGIIIDAVKNGTPLPKNHGRLIDTDELSKGLMERWNTADNNAEKQISQVIANVVTPIVISTPTIIEADAERMAMMNGRK